MTSEVHLIPLTCEHDVPFSRKRKSRDARQTFKLLHSVETELLHNKSDDSILHPVFDHILYPLLLDDSTNSFLLAYCTTMENLWVFKSFSLLPLNGYLRHKQSLLTFLCSLPYFSEYFTIRSSREQCKFFIVAYRVCSHLDNKSAHFLNNAAKILCLTSCVSVRRLGIFPNSDCS